LLALARESTAGHFCLSKSNLHDYQLGHNRAMTATADDRVSAGATAATSAPSKPGDFALPWVEKYRPSRIEDIIGNKDAVTRLQVTDHL